MADITIHKNMVLPTTEWEDDNIWADDAVTIVLDDTFLTDANLKEVWADVHGLLKPDHVDLADVYAKPWTKTTLRNLAACAWFADL